MSLYAVNKLLNTIRNDPETLKAYLAQPQSVLERFALTPAERQAVEEKDFVALYRMGVESFLLLGFAGLQRVNLGRILKETERPAA